MSIDLQIEQILKIKKELYESIKEKGVEFDRKKEFAEYPNEVKKITGGGGSISGQEFTITNNTGSDIKQGDMVWVDWAPYVESESKINEIFDVVYQAPNLLDQSGMYAFNGKKGQCFYIDDLTVTNPNFDFSNSGFRPISYYISKSGEVFYSLNYVSYASELPFRSDLVYCEIGSKLLIPGDSYGSYGQSVCFIGENYFVRIADNAPDGYAKAQVFQVDTSTAKILKQWKLNVPESSRGYLSHLSTSWILHENNKTFLYDFYHGKKYELSMSSHEDLPVSEPLDGISLGTIFPVGFMQNDELMVARVAISTGYETYYPLQIFKKGTSIDDWTLLSSNDLSSNISSYYGNSDLDFIYNPTNQVISISFEKSRNDSYGIPGKAFRFVGINESGKVIFEELPCDVSQFIQTPGSKWEDGVYYSFAPTYSQDCGKYVIAKQIPSHISPDNKSHYQYLVGYAKTGIFLKAVKDPSKLGAFAIQGVAKQNIANNGSGQIVTLALEKVNIQLNSDVELDDILVSTGV